MDGGAEELFIGYQRVACVKVRDTGF